MDVLKHLRVDRESSVPFETQLARQFEQLIASDALIVGSRLPPIRELADQLGINLHTVRAAYQRLQIQGLVVMRQGRGTTVVEASHSLFATSRPQHRSFTIGVVFPAMVSFYEPVLAGMQEASKSDPFRILIGIADERLDSADSYVKYFARETDGTIVVSQTLRQPPAFRGTNAPPIVYADWPGSPSPSITFSSSPIGDLVRHLIDHGRTDLAMITPPSHHPNITPLVATYRAVATDLGLRLRDPTEVPGWTVEDGRIAMEHILESEDLPNAVMCATDPLAVGAIQSIQLHGLVVGRDIAVTGYGEIDISSVTDPGLTTIRLPAKNLGRRAMQCLLNLIAKKPVAPVTELTGHVVERQSCGCP